MQDVDSMESKQQAEQKQECKTHGGESTMDMAVMYENENDEEEENGEEAGEQMGEMIEMGRGGGDFSK